MASINYVKRQLEEAGLTVAVEGDFILCEDPGLFERSHDGVKGISRWLRETLDEYGEACAALFEQSIDEEYGIEMAETNIEEEPMNEFAPAPPEKEHVVDSAQLALAQELNSSKEVAQALEIDDQDHGGIPNPTGYITEKKQEVAAAIVVLVKGQRFLAPDGWKIKEARTDETLYYGSILIHRKWTNERLGSKFSLVRDQ